MVYLIIDSHPVQYRAPLYQELSNQLKGSGITLKVIFGSNCSIRGAIDHGFAREVAWDEPMLEGYDYEFIKGYENAYPKKFFDIRSSEIGRTIKKINPIGVMINGIDYLLNMQAILACNILKIPIAIRSETQDYAFKRSFIKKFIRFSIYSLVYSKINHFFAIGNANKNHYLNHGVSEEKISYSRYCVRDRFKFTEDEFKKVRKNIRNRLGFTSEKVIIFSGKLIPKKNPQSIIKALETLPIETRSKYGLLFVGSGEQQAMLEKKASELGITYYFTGFVNQSEIADYYIASDVLILPSLQMGETWGLVVNEALMAGLDVIVSKHAGSSLDFGHLSCVRVITPNTASIINALDNIKSRPDISYVRKQILDYSMESAARSIREEIIKITSE